MDPKELARQLAAARRFDVEHRGAVFHLCLPSEQQLRRIYRTHIPEPPEPADGAAAAPAADSSPGPALDFGTLDALQRDTVLAAMVGWEGVTDSLVLGEAASGEAVAFDAALAEEWLLADAPLADKLSLEVWGRVRRRREAREADAKN